MHEEIRFTTDEQGLVDQDHALYLDHGFVKFINKLGTDEDLVAFARTSYGKGAYKSAKRNKNLLFYLFEHWHTSPIEAAEMTFSIKMPIFVARQHMRHRTANMNELSLRYQECDGDFYIPDLEQMRMQDSVNKQGSDGVLPEHIAEVLRGKLIEHSNESLELYRGLLHSGEYNLTRELARMVLGTNFYTTLNWKIDLKNLFGYLMLRNDEHAQWEIQQLAKIIEFYVQREFPVAWEAYRLFWKDKTSLLDEEMDVVRGLLTGVAKMAGLHTYEEQERWITSLLDQDGVVAGSDRRRAEFARKVLLRGDE